MTDRLIRATTAFAVRMVAAVAAHIPFTHMRRSTGKDGRHPTHAGRHLLAMYRLGHMRQRDLPEVRSQNGNGPE